MINILLAILEYAAPALGLLSLYRYDYADYTGPVIGLVASALFVVFGIVHEFPGVALSNVVFFAINFKNLRKYL